MQEGTYVSTHIDSFIKAIIDLENIDVKIVHEDQLQCSPRWIFVNLYGSIEVNKS
jgi:hypothetical protein